MTGTSIGKRRCPTGKIRYRDELDAMLALGSTARRSESNRKRRESRQYHCPILQRLAPHQAGAAMTGASLNGRADG